MTNQAMALTQLGAMDYAAGPVASLKACPFCREMFTEAEASECPLCGVALTSLTKLAPSAEAVDADDLDEDELREAALDPDDRRLPITHFGDGRGPLVLLCLVGLAAFALPWVYMHAPDEIALAGHDMAKRSPPAWVGFVSWFTLLPLVLSRRTKRGMRGVRFAAAILAALPALVITILLANPPASAHIRGITVHLRFTWGYGIWLALAVSVLGALIAGLFFGGRRTTA
jgi:hypothetical protein